MPAPQPNSAGPREVWDTELVAFSVLFVCTGNICRSPVAEKLFRAGLDPRADVTVASAGTRAMVGYPIDPPSAAALAAMGVDPDGHHARRLTSQLASHAELILTASAEHRSVVLTATPLAMNRTFTVREFARLAASVPATAVRDTVPDPAALRARVATIAGQRGIVAAPGEGADDIADPYYAGAAVAETTAVAVAQAVAQALAALDLTRPTSH